MPKGCRYIVSFRGPKDGAVSLLKFMEGWFLEAGAVDINDVLREAYFDRPEDRSVFTHLTSWWSQRDNDQVMLLCYEDMLRDSEATMHAVAQFIGIDADEALIAKTLE